MKAMKATAKQRQLALKAKPRSETVKVYATKQLKDLVKRARSISSDKDSSAFGQRLVQHRFLFVKKIRIRLDFASRFPSRSFDDLLLERLSE